MDRAILKPTALKKSSAVAAGLLGLILWGCTVGPDPERPQTQVDLRDPYLAAAITRQPTTAPADEVGGWWRRFADPATNELVAEAVLGNPELTAAAARVVESRALLSQAYGARFPELNLESSISRRKQSITLPGSFGGPGGVGVEGGGGDSIRTSFLTSSYDLNLAAAWQLDLWGRLKRSQQAAGFEFLATAADRQALLHTIVSEAVRARVAIGTLQSRLALAEQNLDSLRQTLQVTESRYRAGVGDPVALRLARENAATAESQIPPLQAELAVRGHALAVLLGRRPGEVEEIENRLPPMPELAPPPLGLPAALLDQRPDVLASGLRARAARARIGVAIADLLPNVTLGAGVGLTSTEVQTLFDRDSQVWNLLVSAVQPLVDAGQRRAGVRAARAEAEAATAEYVGVILRAIREVEDAMVRERLSRVEAEANERALAEARAAETLARDRYAQGLTPLLDVFEAERRRRAAEERLMLARQGVWNARVDLHLALGGDWEISGLADETRPR